MRSKKAVFNIVTKFIYQIASLVSGLVTPRLIISCFGSSYNGIVSSISQFLGIISFLTLGVAGATRVALYGTLARKDTDATSRVIKATEKYMRKVGIALVVYSLLLAVVFPFISKSEIPQFEVSILVCIISMGTFSQYFFGQTYTFLLQADQTEYIATIFRTVACVIDIGVVVALTSLDATMIELRLCLAVVSVISPIAINIFVSKKYKINKHCTPDTTALSQRKYAMFHSVANIVHDNTDVFILTLFTDVSTISVYSIYYGVVRNIKQLMQNLTSGLEGAFGNMWAKGEKKLFRNNFETYEFIMFSFSSVIFTSLGLLLIPFMKIYTRGITDANYVLPSFAILVTITEAIFCIRQPYVIIVQAAGKYKETKNGAMAEAIINFAVSLLCVNLFGLNGVVIGTMVANVFRTVQYAVFCSKNLLERSLFPFVCRLLWHLLNTIIIIFVFFCISNELTISGWMDWLFMSFVCVSISLIVTILNAVIFYRKDLKQVMNFVKRLVVRRG